MDKRYGLIFDVDGVIADTEAVNARASIKVFSKLFGVETVQRKDFEAGLGRGAEEYVKAAAQVHGLELTAEQLTQAVNARQENFLDILKKESLPAYPGVLELINAALADENFSVAIATSSTREKSEAVLQSAKIPYERMVYVTGEQVTNKKPHPELFQHAAELLAVPASRCVVIEDAPNGVQSAKAADAKCIAVTNSVTAENLKQADLIVNSLTEVDISVLKEMVNGK